MSKKTKVWVVTAIAIVVTTLLVVVGFLVLPGLFKKETTQDKIMNSPVGKNITGLVSVAGEEAASVIIAPASEKWWWILSTYSPNPIAYGLDFNKYSEGSKYVAYTASPGGGFESYGYLGLPTSFIIYDDEQKAKVADEKLVNDGVTHQLIGDTIFFVPDGAYSDVHYALNQYKSAVEGEELELNDEAAMFLQYSSLKTIITKDMEELDAETFDTLAGLLGVTVDTSWSGTSSDGFNWKGTFTNLDTATVNKPSDIQLYMADRNYFLNQDGELQPGSEANETNQSGIVFDGQSLIMGDGTLKLQSQTDSSYYLEDGKVVTLPTLKADEGVYRITIDDVNKFTGDMLGKGVYYPYTTFDSITVTMKEDGTSEINIVPDEKLLEGDQKNSEE